MIPCNVAIIKQKDFYQGIYGQFEKCWFEASTLSVSWHCNLVNKTTYPETGEGASTHSCVPSPSDHDGARLSSWYPVAYLPQTDSLPTRYLYAVAVVFLHIWYYCYFISRIRDRKPVMWILKIREMQISKFQGCTNPQHQVVVTTEFCVTTPNIYEFSVWNLPHVILPEPWVFHKVSAILREIFL